MALADYYDPWRGEVFKFAVPLASQANANTFQAAPTIAAGDFKRSIDGGAFANMDNLPAVNPAGGKVVEFTLSANETNCDNLRIIGSDAAGAEWRDIFIELRPKRPVAANLVRTTIATLASQTSFTLTAGSADDDAYTGFLCVVEDANTANQKCCEFVADYVGSTRTITLAKNPGVFTMAAGDRVWILAYRDAFASAVRTLTDPVGEAPEAGNGPDLVIGAGSLWSHSMTGLGSLVGWEKIWITAKQSLNDPDSKAIFQIEKTAGLIVLNRSSAGLTAADGSITIDDVGGSMTFSLKAASNVQLESQKIVYDIKVKLSGAEPVQRTAGVGNVIRNVTRAIS